MKSKIPKILAIIFTVLLVVILLSQIQLFSLIKTLTNIDPWYILLGFILYALSLFFRTLRFYILLNREVGLKNLFNIVCLHNMVNNIMPARTGELSYIYLLKTHHDKNAGEGIATLFVARVFDFISISFLFFISIFMFKDIPEIITKSVWFIFVLFALIVIFLIILLYHGNSFLNLVRTFLRRFRLEERRIIEYSLRKGEEGVHSFEKIRSKKVLFLIFLLSVLILISNYVLIFILLQSMNIQLPFQIVVVGATFMLLTTVSPIYGIGGFGTTEGVWTLVFVPLGLTLETAIISGFSYHIIIWLYFLIAGSYGSLNIYFAGSSQR